MQGRQPQRRLERIYLRLLLDGARITGERGSRGTSRSRLKSASIIIRVAVSTRLVLPGTLPKNTLTSERSQVGINLPSIVLVDNQSA